MGLHGFLALSTNKGEFERKSRFGDIEGQKFDFGPAKLEKSIRHSSGDIQQADGLESGAQRRVRKWSYLSLSISDSMESRKVDGDSTGAGVNGEDAQGVGPEALQS